MRDWNKINLMSRKRTEIIKIEKLECTEFDCRNEIEFSMAYHLKGSGSINTLYVCREHLIKFIENKEKK